MTNLLPAIMMIVGSYGAPADSTIHTYSFNTSNGAAELLSVTTGVPNASFLARVDDHTLLAVNENADQTDALTLLRGSAADGFRPVASALTGGEAPCHVLVSPDRSYAVTSNYLGGSISLFPLDPQGKSLTDPMVVSFTGHGPHSPRQDAPHAHFASFTPDGQFLVVDDLGTDRLHVFPLDERGIPNIDEMHDIELQAGSGPRHITYNEAGDRAYLINELNGTVTVLAYEYGRFVPLESIHADLANGHASADIHLSPDGRFLYVSNRIKGDGIVYFKVDEKSGRLSEGTFMPTGSHPRNFAITPDGNWLLVACRDDNRIEVYRRNPDTGSLIPNSTIPCPKPVCIIFE